MTGGRVRRSKATGRCAGPRSASTTRCAAGPDRLGHAVVEDPARSAARGGTVYSCSSATRDLKSKRPHHRKWLTASPRTCPVMFRSEGGDDSLRRDPRTFDEYLRFLAYLRPGRRASSTAVGTSTGICRPPSCRSPLGNPRTGGSVGRATRTCWDSPPLMPGASARRIRIDKLGAISTAYQDREPHKFRRPDGVEGATCYRCWRRRRDAGAERWDISDVGRSVPRYRTRRRARHPTARRLERVVRPSIRCRSGEARPQLGSFIPGRRTPAL